MNRLNVEDQIRLFCAWFSSWGAAQRAVFLDQLVAKVTPEKLFALTEAIHLSNEAEPVSPEGCTHFDEQCKYFYRCLSGWSVEQSNAFLSELEAIDYTAVCVFYDKVASTAGQA